MSEPCACACERAFPSRRSVIAGFACMAAAPSPARSAGPSSAEDERFMRMALAEAARADFPFGAVIVRDGAVVARGRNLGRTNRDPTAHGEMVAIRRCLTDHGPAVVFAASVAQLAAKIDQIMLSSADVAAKASFAPISITGGVLADEAMALFAK